jgi:[protein-PII] uridylyltransferase
MQINFGTIRQHVSEKLRRLESQGNEAERLAAIRKFLKIETQRLHLRHRFGVSGSQIVAARSLTIDLLIQRAAKTAAQETGLEADHPGQLAVIALGGYGRQELSPHSDIDILFLRGRRESAQASALSERLIYLLWDIGCTVGHVTRSLSECVQIADEDIVSRNALIDARLLWGSQEIFDHLQQKLNDKVFSTRKKALLDELMAERAERYAKFGGVACLQEPNVKESAGGLRDVHSLLYAARIAYGHARLEKLTEAGIIAERDARAMAAAYEFLLRTRSDMHFLTARRTDLLSLDLQQQTAINLRYADTRELQASEIFMRDYYLHARRLHRLCDVYLKKAITGQQKRGWLSRFREMSAPGGFVLRDGVLEISADTQKGSREKNASSASTERLMQAFSYSQATSAAFSSGMEDYIQEHLSLINRTSRSSPQVAQAFMKILRTRGRVAAALRQMHELGFLGKYLPEFGRVTCLVQHDLYHKFTVDEHTIRTIESLDELHNSRSRGLERWRTLYHESSDPDILHLALLMHDIGKGLGGGHTEKGIVIAEKVCSRLHLLPEQIETVKFLVRHHLTLSHTAQRRDLADEKVIETFATQMGTVENLKLLTLLTYADINGVGPGVWNEWKDALIWELYQKALRVLQPANGGEDSVEKLRDHIAHMLVSEIGIEEVRHHFEQLPEDYARFTASQTIIEHIRLAHSLNSRAVRTSWRVNVQARCTDLHLCARNRRGLLAAIAGTLAAQGVNILSVSLSTRADGLAIDSFKVCDTVGEPISDPTRWEKLDDEIRRAVTGESDVAAVVTRRLQAQASKPRRRSPLKPVPTRITWDNESSDKNTIIEVRASDRLGLAYRIASTLSALDLDIVFAKVATEKNLALDIFSITNAAGRKLAEADLPLIEQAVRNALSESVNPVTPQAKSAATR